MNLIKLFTKHPYYDESYDEIYIEANLTKEKIAKAYKLGVKITKFDLVKLFDDGYRGNYIDDDEIKILEKFKFNPKWFRNKKTWQNKEWRKNCAYLEIDQYFDIYLFIVKSGNPEFEYNIIKFSPIHIGGTDLY